MLDLAFELYQVSVTNKFELVKIDALSRNRAETQMECSACSIQEVRGLISWAVDH